MTTHAPIFARERNAAKVLDMTPAEFRAADKRRAVMGANEEVTVAHVADHVGKSARK